MAGCRIRPPERQRTRRLAQALIAPHLDSTMRRSTVCPSTMTLTETSVIAQSGTSAETSRNDRLGNQLDRGAYGTRTP